MSDLEEIRTLPIDELPRRVALRRFQTRTCLTAFLERCRAETYRNANRSTSLCAHGPDFVDRVFEVGTDQHSNYMVWTLGIVATSFSLAGTRRMAEITFEEGQRFTPADPLERAAFDVRHAFHRAQFEWDEAYKLVTGAVARFRESGSVSRPREDYSLSFSLAHRGVINGYGYQLGHDAADPEDACKDFQEAASLSVGLPGIQLMAISGIARMAVKMWMAGRSVTFATPRSVVADIELIRRQLRQSQIPLRSVVDSKCRWMLGLGYFMLAGKSLTRQSERYLREARADLIEVSTPLEVVEITLDFQWCLIEDGRFSEACDEYRFIKERIDAIPARFKFCMELWAADLAQNRLRAKVMRDVFEQVRGVHQLTVPGARMTPAPVSQEAPIGW